MLLATSALLLVKLNKPLKCTEPVCFMVLLSVVQIWLESAIKTIPSSCINRTRRLSGLLHYENGMLLRGLGEGNDVRLLPEES